MKNATFLAVLGRQSALSLAELESLFLDVKKISPQLATFTLGDNSPVKSNYSGSKIPDNDRLGGSLKLAREINDPLEYIINDINDSHFSGKLIIGISDYSKKANRKTCQVTALQLKKELRKQHYSVRVLDNKSAILSTATVFHNHLGDKPGHYEFIHFQKRWFVGIGVQNITSYTARDQARPARDARVGMLPPKLAQILINLCGPLPEGATVLDPFCGTGVVLQEAVLMGYHAYGTDLSARMIEYSKKNLTWLTENIARTSTFRLAVGSASDFAWEQPLNAVACEGYLGPPMSQIPPDIKMKSVMKDLIPLYYHTLRNLSRQIAPGAPVVIAVPAWLRPDHSYHRLFDLTKPETLDEVNQLGYNVVKYQNLSLQDLLYYREGQIVAREIIVLRKK